MELFLGILDVIVMFAMITLVLLHSGKGGGLSDMLGGGASTAMGSTAAERNLNRITMVFAVAFVFLTIGLGLLMD